MSKNTKGTKPFGPNDFYRAYAIAMLEWQNVETALFRLYYMLFEHGELLPIAASYYSLDSFGSKLRLVDGTAKSVLTPERVKEWQSIKKVMEKFAAERNVLAHLPAEIEVQADNSLTLVLIPGVFVPTTLYRPKKRKYDATGCETLANEFQQLSKQIDAFAEKDAAYVVMGSSFLGTAQ